MTQGPKLGWKWGIWGSLGETLLVTIHSHVLNSVHWPGFGSEMGLLSGPRWKGQQRLLKD